MRTARRIAVAALLGLPAASPAATAPPLPVKPAGAARAGAKPLPVAPAPPPLPALPPPATGMAEVRVAPGAYYVGKAMGARDYKALANATMPGYFVLRGEVTQGQFSEIVAWGTLHGYAFEDACATCERDHAEKPAAGLSWRDAALIANALSERSGLDAVYRDQAGQPVRAAARIDHAVVEPTLTGFRLPTIPEWQIALRGGDKAIADGSYGAPGSPNALGLSDNTGPLAEWTASSMDLGDGKPMYFFCNQSVDGVIALSHCDLHSPSVASGAVAVRLVRKGSR